MIITGLGLAMQFRNESSLNQSEWEAKNIIKQGLNECGLTCVELHE